jgi:hypothetical protein
VTPPPGDRRPQDRRAAERRVTERRAGGRSAERRPADRPRREVVTSPRTLAARRPRYSLTREIDEQTQLGEVYMRSLVRTQLRLGLFVCTLLGCVVGGLPLLFLLVPELREVSVLGLPLPWLLLGGLIYPLFVLGGHLYVRSAERNERDFADLVDRT